MPVDQIPPPRMPQPEQWLFEHPFVNAALIVGLVGALIVVIVYWPWP